MRWIVWLVVSCLLCAGTSTRHPDPRGTDRPNDEIVAVKVLAKLVVRRFDGTRLAGKLGLDPFALAHSDRDDDAPRTPMTIELAGPRSGTRAPLPTHEARGPPEG